jgi:hypothetical protein
MEGFKGYQHRVKIGNWSEDMELEAVCHIFCFECWVGDRDPNAMQGKLKDYLLRKQRGELASSKAEQRFAHALKPATLKPRNDDSFVHFGDTLMLFNQATDGCLACDPHETLPEDGFAVTSTWYTEPCSRNTFEICPWTGRGDKKDAMFDFKDDVVHFGQKIQIRCSGALVPEQPFLVSMPKTLTSFSRYSRNQEVCMRPRSEWSTVWEVQYLDPQYKMEMEGQVTAPLAHPASCQHERE